MARPYKPSKLKYKHTTRQPRKCMLCGSVFWGHWNKVYCGEQKTKNGVKAYGCAYTRSKEASVQAHERFMKERYAKWYEEYKKTDRRKESWRKATAKYKEKIHSSQTIGIIKSN